MSFGDHLEELRRRLMHAIIGIGPIFVVALIFGKELLGFLIKPVQAQLRAANLPASMQTTGVLELFGTYIHVSVIVTILVGSPWILFQLWKFVSPGLYRHERRFVYFLLPLSTVLTVVGVTFLYMFILPLLLSFFIGFGSDVGRTTPTTVEPPAGMVFPKTPVVKGDPLHPAKGDFWVNTEMHEWRVCVEAPEGQEPTIMGLPLTRGSGVNPHYRVTEYVSLFLTLCLAFAIAFQMPVVVLLLGWAGLIDRAFLAKYRKHAIMFCGVAAALLTPGDPMSMLLLAIPLYGLYELGGYLLKVFPAGRIAGKREPADAGDP